MEKIGDGYIKKHESKWHQLTSSSSIQWDVSLAGTCSCWENLVESNAPIFFLGRALGVLAESPILAFMRYRIISYTEFIRAAANQRALFGRSWRITCNISVKSFGQPFCPDGVVRCHNGSWTERKCLVFQRQQILTPWAKRTCDHKSAMAVAGQVLVQFRAVEIPLIKTDSSEESLKSLVFRRKFSQFSPELEVPPPLQTVVRWNMSLIFADC